MPLGIIVIQIIWAWPKPLNWVTTLLGCSKRDINGSNVDPLTNNNGAPICRIIALMTVPDVLGRHDAAFPHSTQINTKTEFLGLLERAKREFWVRKRASNEVAETEMVLCILCHDFVSNSKNDITFKMATGEIKVEDVLLTFLLVGYGLWDAQIYPPFDFCTSMEFSVDVYNK
jgi:hypothetical protein